MTLTRRLGAILVTCLMVFAVPVVLSSATRASFEVSDAGHVQYEPETSALVRHAHGDADWSEDCHPGLACSLSAISTHRKNITRKQTASHMQRVTVVRMADRFAPVSDPPPPRRAV